MGFGEACLICWGKDGQPVRKDKSILAKLVTVSAPSPGLGPWLARFLAGSQVRGSPLGQANSANPLPTPPPSPMPKAGSVQLPVPSNKQWGKAAQTAWPRFSLLFLGTAAPALLWSPRDALPRELQPGRNSGAGGANKKHFSEGLF